MALVALTPAAASPLDRLPVDAAWLPRGVGLLERPDEAGHGTAVAAAHGTPRHDVARPEPTVARAARHRAGPTGRPVAARPLRHTADGVARRTGPVRGIDRVPVLGVVRPLGSRPLTAPERRDTTGPATEADLSTATGANAGAAAAWAARLADAWGSPSTAAAPAVAASPGTVAPSVMGRPSGSSAAPSAASVASAASSAVRRAENGPPPALAVRRVPAVVARLAALLPRAAAVAGVVVAPSPLAPAPARLTPIGAPTWTPAARAGAPSPTATSDRGAVGRARRTARRTSGSLEVGVVASVQRGPTRPAPVAPASTRAAIGGRPRPLHRSLSRPESGEPTSPSAPLAGKPTRGRPPSGPGTAEGSHPSAAERRPSVPSAPGAPAGPFAVTSSGVVSPAPRRGPFAVSPSGVVTAALPVRPAGPAPSDSSGGRTPDVPTSSSIRRSPVAATDVARGRTTDTARRSSPAVPHGASPSPVARVTSRPAHRRHALAAHLAQAGTRRGRALPTSFRPLARLLGDATVEVRHDAGAREALRRAGRPAATIGSTILLDRAPSDAPAMVERLAHELVHASERRPSPPRFFDDPQRDHEERRAHTIGRLARSLGPEAVPAALGAAGALPVRLSAIDGPAANATNATNASNATNATNVAGALGGVTSDVVPTPVFARSAVRRSASASAASRSTVRRSAASIGGAADGPEPGGPSPAPVERRSSTTTVARRSPAGTATAAPRTERTTSTQAPRESATARLDRVDELVAMVEARVIAELERRGGRHRGWL